jgi:Gamma-glutamyl cyclotransferase, AIG2-like
MPILFSYGTLQQEDVQLSTFGRLLHGQPDELPGFEPSAVRIDDPQVVAKTGKTHYANIISSAQADSRVSGTVFEVTDLELAAADRYEQAAGFKRIKAALASGKQGWVYVECVHG